MIAAAPSLLSMPLRGWHFDAGLEAVAALYLLLYAWATLRVRTWPAWRAACFAAGVGVVLVALQSGVDGYDDRLLSDHMVQHMLLLMVAPVLLLLGRPVTLALRALRPAQRPGAARAVALMRPLAAPLPALAIFAAVVLGTHLPGFYDATLRHPLLHDTEHAAYLLAGLLLFTPLLDADPGARRRLGGVGRLAYLIAASPAMALVGAYLNDSTSVVYAPYASAARALGISAVLDQRRAGAIMWVGGGVLLTVVGLTSALATMIAEERRMSAREWRADLAAQASIEARR